MYNPNTRRNSGVCEEDMGSFYREMKILSHFFQPLNWEEFQKELQEYEQQKRKQIQKKSKGKRVQL